jgi:aldose 1-epimerase
MTQVRALSASAVIAALLFSLTFGCAMETTVSKAGASGAVTPAGIRKSAFGKTREGTPVDLYTLTNARGVTVGIITYGATVTRIVVPDRAGKMANVALGFDSIEGYLGEHPYLGAAVGRYANRIGKAAFTLNGMTYKLATNNGPNHLHGGLKGFNRVVWNAEPVTGTNAIRLTYTSRDGEEGYPGNLDCTIVYTLTDANELKIEYAATTDQPTPINLTNHSYFNLSGPGTGDILGHQLMLAADRYTPVDDGLIPTGVIAPVKGTPLDFTQPQSFGARIASVQGGYDHNFVLNSGGSRTPVLAARVKESSTGRVMEVLTTQPGVQLYTGNFLDGSVKGSGGAYKKHYGFCLETQHFPDSPNKPVFPSAILSPGQKYYQVTVYRFSAE